MTTILLLAALSLAVPQETQKEKPRVPSDSVEVVIVGCLTGRVIAVDDVRETDTSRGPIVKAKSFRLAGKKDVMNIVKEENHRIVEITGIVKKSALMEEGMKVGNNRVTIGGGRPVAGSSGLPSPVEYVPVLDVESVQPRGTSCGGGL